MTMSLNLPSFSIKGFLVLVILLAVGAIGLNLSHGVEKHGTDAELVRACYDANGAMSSWFNPETNRCVEVVKVGECKFGCRVLEDIDGIMQEITAYVKNKMTDPNQVGNYLKNRGYQELMK